MRISTRNNWNEAFTYSISTTSKIVDRKLQKTLILEDDFRPEPRFKQRLSHLMSETDRLQLDWDLL